MRPTNASFLSYSLKFCLSILVLLFLVLFPYSSLGCGRRGAAGRLRRHGQAQAPRAGSGATGRLRRHGQAQAPRAGSGAASGVGGGHHVWDRAGSRRLPPQRPARALPRLGPHAPISEELLGGVGGRSATRREEALEAGFAAVAEADGERRGGQRSPFLWSGLRAARCPLAKVGRFWSEGHRWF